MLPSAGRINSLLIGSLSDFSAIILSPRLAVFLFNFACLPIPSSPLLLPGILVGNFYPPGKEITDCCKGICEHIITETMSKHGEKMSCLQTQIKVVFTHKSGTAVGFHPSFRFFYSPYYLQVTALR